MVGETDLNLLQAAIAAQDPLLEKYKTRLQQAGY